jgi:hypothetical protein
MRDPAPHSRPRHQAIPALKHLLHLPVSIYTRPVRKSSESLVECHNVFGKQEKVLWDCWVVGLTLLHCIYNKVSVVVVYFLVCCYPFTYIQIILDCWIVSVILLLLLLLSCCLLLSFNECVCKSQNRCRILFDRSFVAENSSLPQEMQMSFLIHINSLKTLINTLLY